MLNNFLQIDSSVPESRIGVLKDFSYDGSYPCPLHLQVKDMDSFVGFKDFCYLDDRIFVLEGSNAYFVRYSDDMSNGLYISKDFRIVTMHERTEDFVHYMDILYHLYNFYLINVKLSLCIHASSVIAHNVAIAFIGVSGIGKSTQARLWAEQVNARIINFDKPALIRNEAGYCVCGTPWGGKENYSVNVSAPLYCIVSLRQSKTNTIRKLTFSESYLTLYGMFMPLLINEEMREIYETIIIDIAERVVVYELCCTPDKYAVDILYNEIFGNKQKEKKARKMRIKNGYMLKQIVEDWVVIPRGAAAMSCKSTLLLNETGLFIWKCLAEGTSEEEIVDKLSREFSTSKESVQKDVREFIDRLFNEGYIEECN